MAHIALAVRDQERSRGFYEKYFDFDPLTARVAEDGVLLIEGPDGILLALAETDEAIQLPSFLHFGFRAAESPAQVHAFRDRLAGDGVEIVEQSDEPGYVSVKCRDPDGYVIEFAWEPDRR
jgi:catechol 2,3-dioxygenase-like lactoylglutathione lyase family enzyme